MSKHSARRVNKSAPNNQDKRALKSQSRGSARIDAAMKGSDRLHISVPGNATSTSNGQRSGTSSNGQRSGTSSNAQRSGAASESPVMSTMREAKEQLTSLTEQTGDVVSNAGKATVSAVSKASKATADAVTKASKAAIDAVAANPIPIALAGIGVACAGVGITWLLLSGAKDATQAGARSASSTEGKSMLNGMSERVQAIKGVAKTTGSKMASLAGQAGTQAMRLEDQLETMVKAHPMAAGAALLAVGAAIGLAIPRSALEDTWLGRERDQLFANASRLMKGALHKAEAVAQQVIAPSGSIAQA